MKKQIRVFLILVIFGTHIIKAQIPNSGFENWTKTNSIETPDFWSTLNTVTAASSLFTAEKASPGNPGTYYLKLTSKSINGIVVPGIAVSGQMNMQTYQALSGFACAVRPTALAGKWQHMIYGTSQGSIEIQFTRWDNTNKNRITVGSGKVTLSGMAMSWANFSIPITYSDPSNPDSCIIQLKASGITPTDRDYLWVDNLSFTGVSGIKDAKKELPHITVYPNPAIEEIHVHLSSNQTTNALLEVVDITGKSHFKEQIELKAGENDYVFPTEDFPSGIYFLSVTTEKTKHCCRFSKK